MVDQLERRATTLLLTALLQLAALTTNGDTRRSATTPAPSRPPGGDEFCVRVPGPANRARRVVVARPYGPRGQQVPRFELLTLSTSGRLAATGQTFSLGGWATSGEIAFTPDGKIGLLALHDGSVGAFSIGNDGKVRVVHASLQTGAVVSRIVMDPDGGRAYLLSSQWEDLGGGIYSVRILCNGSLRDEGLVQAARLPDAMIILKGKKPTRALVVATRILSSTRGDDVHAVTVGAPWKLLHGVDAFDENAAMVSDMALTADGRFLLLADTNVFRAGAGDRVAVVQRRSRGGLRAVQVLRPLRDPVAVVTSPFDNTALVLNGERRAITVLRYTAGSSPPFKARRLATSTRPRLPTDAVVVRRGPLKGRVLITENTSIRQVQFRRSGGAKEIGRYSLGRGYTAIPGAIGIQP